MAFEALLAELQIEASCPLCLDYLTNPVTLDCGHNFCGSCIQERWEDLEDIFPCPICLHHSSDKNFKKNTQLCHITDVIKQLPARISKCKLQEELLCEMHNEVVDQFCEKDLELLCPQCSVSSGHKDHLLIPIEKAIVSQRENLKDLMKVLKLKIEDAEMSCESQILKSFELKMKMEAFKKELEPEFEELKVFLRKKQVSIIANLHLEEKNVGKKLKRDIIQISKHISTIKNLLREITMKSLQTDMDLLRSIADVHDRYEMLSTPGIYSYKLKKESSTLPPHYFGLHRMISTFQTELTIDPESGHPCLIVSEDKKSVMLGKNSPTFPENPPACITFPAILSYESLDAGRHFWQVEVRGTGEWSLGLCTESIFKNRLMSPNQKTCFWTSQESKRISNTWDTAEEEEASRFGVFVDFELGEFSVYDLNNRTCLYKYADQFTDKMMPYFAIGPSSERFSITLITEE
ncbi:tripartite motif-containing protein 60-like [Sorex araneus]|uniref:tripartite motif-containing protein 60-like n=1 Tax=Sorex araneus TaxID=42254 RepID=UPI002433B5F7|nr:tripartite motif-containing protein 60-like [Sorex araneus]